MVCGFSSSRRRWLGSGDQGVAVLERGLHGLDDLAEVHHALEPAYHTRGVEIPWAELALDGGPPRRVDDLAELLVGEALLTPPELHYPQSVREVDRAEACLLANRHQVGEVAAGVLDGHEKDVEAFGHRFQNEPLGFRLVVPKRDVSEVSLLSLGVGDAQCILGSGFDDLRGREMQLGGGRLKGGLQSRHGNSRNAGFVVKGNYAPASIDLLYHKTLRKSIY